jgi:hypothetical protein
MQSDRRGVSGANTCDARSDARNLRRRLDVFPTSALCTFLDQ